MTRTTAPSSSSGVPVPPLLAYWLHFSSMRKLRIYSSLSLLHLRFQRQDIQPSHESWGSTLLANSILISSSQVSKTPVVYVSFETYPPLANITHFIKARRKDPIQIRHEIVSGLSSHQSKSQSAFYQWPRCCSVHDEVDSHHPASSDSSAIVCLSAAAF